MPVGYLPLSEPEQDTPSSRELDDSEELEKRTLPPETPGGEDGFSHEYIVHKNISQVYAQSIEEAKWKPNRLVRSVRKPSGLVWTFPLGTSWIGPDWVHPGFKWMVEFRTAKGRLVVFRNTTDTDKEAIIKRIQNLSVFEKSAKESGLSGLSAEQKRSGEDDKRWFHQNFDRVEALPSQKGALFVPINTTDAKKKDIRYYFYKLAEAYHGPLRGFSWALGELERFDEWEGLDDIGVFDGGEESTANQERTRVLKQE
ncbi:hypothetical protein ACHAPT_011048 [Fusarium lateritium]